mmetsp:Transcript_80991/g.196374  ORF Transcript_80991/g.196374 Transcript_80991/m.196374 type:complete len:597 (+) Transcript_80991:100-1890(+)
MEDGTKHASRAAVRPTSDVVGPVSLTEPAKAWQNGELKPTGAADAPPRKASKLKTLVRANTTGFSSLYAFKRLAMWKAEDVRPREPVRWLHLVLSLSLLAGLPAVGVLSWGVPLHAPTATWEPNQWTWIFHWWWLTLITFFIVAGILTPFTPTHLDVFPVGRPLVWAVVSFGYTSICFVLHSVIPWAVGVFPVPTLAPTVGIALWPVFAMIVIWKFVSYVIPRKASDEGAARTHTAITVATTDSDGREERRAGRARTAQLAEAAPGPVPAAAAQAPRRSPGDHPCETFNRSRAGLARTLVGILFSYGLFYSLHIVYMVTFYMAADSAFYQTVISVVFSYVSYIARSKITGYFLRYGHVFIVDHGAKYSIPAILLFFSELFSNLLFPTISSVWVFIAIIVLDNGQLIFSGIFTVPGAFRLWLRAGMGTPRKSDVRLSRVLRCCGFRFHSGFPEEQHANPESVYADFIATDERCNSLAVVYLAEVLASVCFVITFWWMTIGPNKSSYVLLVSDEVDVEQTLLYTFFALLAHSVVFVLMCWRVYHLFGINMVRCMYGVLTDNPHTKWTLALFFTGALKATELLFMRQSYMLSYVLEQTT